MSQYIGVDIGGTKIYAACYDEDLNITSEYQLPTQGEKGTEGVYQNILKAINTVKTTKTKSIGIAWAGFVDPDGQTIRKGPNIGYIQDFELGQRLQRELNIPVIIGNDARLFAYAEAHIKPDLSPCLLGIILGTGVGSGLIMNGKIFKGAHNFAGEIGHIKPNKVDELEHLIAGPGMTQYLKEKFPITTLSDMDMYFQEDEISHILMATVKPRLELLTSWLANLALIFDPSEIVIGGGAGIHFWSHFHKQIQAEVDDTLKNYPTKIIVRFSELKNAGAVGAAILGKNQLA